MFFLLKIYSCHEMRSMSNSFKAFKTRLPLSWSLRFGFWNILPCVLSHVEIRSCYCYILSLGWLWLRCVNHLQEFGEVSGATQTLLMAGPWNGVLSENLGSLLFRHVFSLPVVLLTLRPVWLSFLVHLVSLEKGVAGVGESWVKI